MGIENLVKMEILYELMREEEDDAWRDKYQEIYGLDPEEICFAFEEEFTEAVEERKEELVEQYHSTYDELDEKVRHLFN